jgi:nucleoside-diphosphate-sugar epimerase
VRILITGASGYIGRLTLAPLAARGIDVHAASRRDISSVPGISAHRVDLLAPGAPDHLIAAARPDLVLHFAWNATPGVYLTTPENHEWRRATVELARACFDAGGTRFVMAGSCFEYEPPVDSPCDEQRTPLLAATIYGESKTATWQDVERIAAVAGGQAACGRIFYVFGGDEYPSRLVPSVARALLAGEPALCSHGEQVRDFLHVEDVASAFVALTLSGVVGPVNIASGVAVRVRDLIEGVASRLGRPDLIRLGARPMTEPMSITANVTRLRDEVRWRPGRTLNRALDEAVGFWTHDRYRVQPS